MECKNCGSNEVENVNKAHVWYCKKCEMLFYAEGRYGESKRKYIERNIK